MDWIKLEAGELVPPIKPDVNFFDCLNLSNIFFVKFFIFQKNSQLNVREEHKTKQPKLTDIGIRHDTDDRLYRDKYKKFNFNSHKFLRK